MNFCAVHFNYGNCEFPVYTDSLGELVKVMEDAVKNRKQLQESDVEDFMEADQVKEFTLIFNSANFAPSGTLVVQVQRVEDTIQITSITKEALAKRGTPYLVCSIRWNRKRTL